MSKKAHIPGIDYAERDSYFMDIATIIFSLNARIVPFPVWRTEEPASGSTERSASVAELARILRLNDSRGSADQDGPTPGPTAA
jgi:hypothetical protein